MKTQNFGLLVACCEWVALFRFFEFLMKGADCASLQSGAERDFKRKRINGNESDNPSQKMPEDGKYTWVKGRVKGQYVYGAVNGNNYEYEVRYDQGPGDKAWMEETDKNYLQRIEREGKLKELEPSVWCLRVQEGATGTCIRAWWTEKLKLPEPQLRQLLEADIADPHTDNILNQGW